MLVEQLAQCPALRDLRAYNGARRRANDQVCAAHVDPRLLKAGEDARFPGDAQRAAAAQNECVLGHRHRLLRAASLSREPGAISRRLTQTTFGHRWAQMTH